MKGILLLFIISCGIAFAQLNTEKFGALSKEDQKYYKNEVNMGMNQVERTDSMVKEINKLHGEIAQLKSDMQKMSKEIEDLKKGK